MNGPYVLDACSLIAFLNAEEGADKVKALLDNDESDLYMHMVNLCEVYYGYYKVEGKDKSEKVVENVLQLPVEYVEDLSLDFIKAVGKFKATEKISLADAFVLALAEMKNGKVVTTDHTEFDNIDQKGKVKFFWVR